MTAPTQTIYARCPGCQTVFRVSGAQIALREGQVRCGHCRAVFDANKERVTLDAPRSEDVEEHDELAAGRPTVTLRSADALQPVEAPKEGPSSAETSPPAIEPAASGGVEATAGQAAPATTIEGSGVEATAVEATAVEATAVEATAVEATAVEANAVEATAPEPAQAQAPIRIDDVGPRSARFEWRPRKPLRERPRAVYAAAIVVLVAALAAQALFEYRDALAAHVPLTRPILQAACGIVGCSVGPLRDAGALSIDASDLRADPAHRGLLKLSATIRNRASYPIAWPYLELTLTDASDRVVARRAFAPADYAGNTSDVPPGIPGNGENVVSLYLDASETSQSGYRLYLFYP